MVLGQHMITANSWEMKVCPLHPSSCPKQPVLQSPTSLSFVITKNRGKPFLLVYIVMQNETFFCNELDQTVCFLALLGPEGGGHTPCHKDSSNCITLNFMVLWTQFFLFCFYGHKNRMKRTKKAKLTDFESLLVPPPAFHGEVDKEG